MRLSTGCSVAITLLRRWSRACWRAVVGEASEQRVGSYSITSWMLLAAASPVSWGYEVQGHVDRARHAGAVRYRPSWTHGRATVHAKTAQAVAVGGVGHDAVAIEQAGRRQHKGGGRGDADVLGVVGGTNTAKGVSTSSKVRSGVTAIGVSVSTGVVWWPTATVS